MQWNILDRILEQKKDISGKPEYIWSLVNSHKPVLFLLTNVPRSWTINWLKDIQELCTIFVSFLQRYNFSKIKILFKKRGDYINSIIWCSSPIIVTFHLFPKHMAIYLKNDFRTLKLNYKAGPVWTNLSHICPKPGL